MSAGPIVPDALLLVDCTAMLSKTNDGQKELEIYKSYNLIKSSNEISNKRISIPHDTPAKEFQNILFTSGVVGLDVNDPFEKQATDALSALEKVLHDNWNDYYHALKCNV